MKKYLMMIITLPLLLALSGCTNMNMSQVLYELTHPTGEITGIVLDRQTKKPVSYIDLQVVVGGRNTYYASTLADGSFVIQSIPAGRHSLEVIQYTPRYAAKKYQAQSQTVVVERNKKSYLEIEVDEVERLPLRGYLRDSNNQPIAGVEVTLSDSGAHLPYEKVVTDESGFFKANVYAEPHTLFFQKYYSWSDHFAGNREVAFPTENDLEIYHWVGEFDEKLDYHLEDRELTVTWPKFAIDRDVQYEIVLSRNLRGYRLPIRSITTTELTAIFELTLQTEYGVDFYAYDKESGELLDYHVGHLYWVDLAPQRASDQVEIFLNQFQTSFNNRDFELIQQVISENYTDNRGRTKEEILQVLSPQIEQSILLGIYNFHIESSTNETDGLAWAVVDLEYWLGTEQTEIQHAFATATLVLEDGELQIIQMELKD